MGELSPWHLLIVVAVFVLLFGANKLPQMARSVGQSMRIFKAETRALSGEKEPEQLPPTASASPPTAQAQSSQAQSSQAQSHQAPSAHVPLPKKPPAS
ncbi:MAG: Sec-independent protein translocase subunit TatA [Pseudonocardiales bacterium]|nr:Sec-independent protein translocase subunit TatA [Pseudonocardiales bacterium]